MYWPIILSASLISNYQQALSHMSHMSHMSHTSHKPSYRAKLSIAIAPPPEQHQSFSLLLRYGGGTPPLNQAELRDGR